MNVRRHMLARGTKAAGWNIVRLLIIIGSDLSYQACR